MFDEIIGGDVYIWLCDYGVSFDIFLLLCFFIVDDLILLMVGFLLEVVVFGNG